MRVLLAIVFLRMQDRFCYLPIKERLFIASITAHLHLYLCVSGDTVWLLVWRGAVVALLICYSQQYGQKTKNAPTIA